MNPFSITNRVRSIPLAAMMLTKVAAIIFSNNKTLTKNLGLIQKIILEETVAEVLAEGEVNIPISNIIKG